MLREKILVNQAEQIKAELESVLRDRDQLIARSTVSAPVGEVEELRDRYIHLFVSWLSCNLSLSVLQATTYDELMAQAWLKRAQSSQGEIPYWEEAYRTVNDFVASRHPQLRFKLSLDS